MSQKVVILDYDRDTHNAEMLSTALEDSGIELSDISNLSVDEVRSVVSDASVVVMEVVDGSTKIHQRAMAALDELADSAVPFVVWSTHDEACVRRLIARADFDLDGGRFFEKGKDDIHDVAAAVVEAIAAQQERTMRFRKVEVNEAT